MDVIKLKREIVIRGDNRRKIVQENEDNDGVTEITEEKNDVSGEKRKRCVGGRAIGSKRKTRSEWNAIDYKRSDTPLSQREDLVNEK